MYVVHLNRRIGLKIGNTSFKTSMLIIILYSKKENPKLLKTNAVTHLSIVYGNTWLGNTILIFVIKQIC